MLNPLNIRPDIQGHVNLEKRFTKYLNDQGFIVEPNTYHDHYNKRTVALLSRRHSPTSQYVRGRADKFAIHEIYPIEFEFDAKTHVNQRYTDLTLEALPLVNHIHATKTKKRTLYVFTDAHGVDRCFWVTNKLPIREIHIPDRWNEAQADELEEIIRTAFPRTPLRRGVRSGGSGDAYVIIDGKDVAKMQPYETEVNKLLKTWRA